VGGADLDALVLTEPRRGQRPRAAPMQFPAKNFNRQWTRMDTNGHELIRIKKSTFLCRARPRVGPFRVSGATEGNGLTQGEALQFRIVVGPDLVSVRAAT